MSTDNNQPQALLVDLHFRMCRQSRQSKEEAHAVEDKNQAARGTTRVNFFYFQEEIIGDDGKPRINDALAAIKSFHGAWGAEHRFYSKAWPGSSSRLLPAALAGQYIERMKWYESKAQEIYNGFFEVYEDWATTAPERMGQLYSAKDYPSLEECKNDIGASRSAIPLPQAAQWKALAVISPDLIADFEKNNKEQFAKGKEEGRREQWNQLIEPVQKIVDVCTKDKAKIFDSLIGNLVAILDVAPAYSELFGDQVMSQYIAEAKKDLAVIKPDDLRNDPEIRKQVAQSAQVFLSKFAALGVRKFD